MYRLGIAITEWGRRMQIRQTREGSIERIVDSHTRMTLEQSGVLGCAAARLRKEWLRISRGDECRRSIKLGLSSLFGKHSRHAARIDSAAEATTVTATRPGLRTASLHE